jgi:hypothetical protein
VTATTQNQALAALLFACDGKSGHPRPQPARRAGRMSRTSDSSCFFPFIAEATSGVRARTAAARKSRPDGGPMCCANDSNSSTARG